ncbi:ABC transporter ATP-binding protein [Candidatus Nanobsidianus stetteri]|jgi:putative ABC transport system ATP-binding protein|uniref:ABC transporter ATP-binding protein n=1 Tax=Nanobsidianus stetteri TaxID=1294122 RepID=A0A2T9WM15_NANST|nr:ABC transporter ATP-binding protein [Candidatus Nanobsidianus stetteri]MCC5446851.1 ABC transporter ATP-binding protein [Candidatus Nanobsidianus stetteri]PVU70747.1 ABC transporter ATP-binding protein [Candidatus Nanobsidianus stetteri]
MIVKLENVEKIYYVGGYPIKALDNVSLEIKEGEFLSIVGPSGSGKSTLLAIMGCLDRPTKGRVYLFDKDISKLNDNQLSELRRKYIGFIFQQYYLFNYLNALENVQIGLRISGNNNLEKAKELLNKVGLGDRLYNYPNQLSGGQQQRVVIARALAKDPKLILADEPTANIDEKSAKELLDILKKLNEDENRTIVIVTHDLRVAEKTNRIVVIRNGKILKDNATIDETIELLK